MRHDILKFFESFLCGRRQRVVLGEMVSEWKAVTSGVPQVSVLGPLFFVLYINEFMVRHTHNVRFEMENTYRNESNKREQKSRHACQDIRK